MDGLLIGVAGRVFNYRELFMSTSPYSASALKLGAVHFLTGKAVSALLTFIILLWLVRLLTVEEYGAYVTLVAGMELTLALTSFGLIWVAARYLPDFRLNASGKVLARFTWQIIARIGLFLLAGLLLLFVALPWILVPLNLAHHTGIAQFYLLVILAEGLGRHLRESILEPLLQQGKAQISLVIRNMSFLLFLSIVAVQGQVHLDDVVMAELVASLLGTALALHGLVVHLRAHRNLLQQDGWQTPDWREMWGLARHMYFSRLVTLAYSPQVFIFLVQRYLGVESTALFGFLRSLYGQIFRYLPATLLFSLVRPKLIASCVGPDGMSELSRNANLAGKLSLFVLTPILVFAWLAGDELLTLLSSGKFTQSGYYLAGLLMSLVPLSQRQLLETVAVANGKSRLCLWGASLGLLVLPLTYSLLESGLLGLWSPIIAIFLSEVIFNAAVVVVIAKTTVYRPDALGFFKLTAAALAAFVLARQIVPPTYSWLGLMIAAAVGCGFFILAAYFVKPFRTDERARLNRLLGRRIFVW